MNARTMALHKSMQRIALVIENIAPLRERAAESNAFRFFNQEIAEFDDIRVQDAVVQLESEALKRRVKLLVERVRMEVACIDAAAQFVPRAECLPAFDVPPDSLHVRVFHSHVTGILRAARKNDASLIAAGMHPGKLDDVERSIEELLAADMNWCMSQAAESLLPVRLEHLVIRARKRIRQLYYELAPVMSPEFRDAWKIAASLGRTHRPKQLAAGAETRLLTAGTIDVRADAVEQAPEGSEDSAGEEDDNTSRMGISAADSTSVIGRLAQRVVQRIVGSDEKAPA